jgi:alkanesulfonate monooxygenase SsuD/methylene tetrahydromethanopterin reductase-like flavin-dependent oxidoreductase (luciferase family)
MRLGLWMMPLHPPDRPLWSTLEENTEKALFADQLGFDELWAGEHFANTAEPVPSPLMFMASLIPRVRGLSFGTAVINLPFHHPVIVAAEAAQFDHLSRGRFMMGIGPGGLYSDFALFDVEDAGVRARMVIEAAEIVQGLWSQAPPHDFSGEFWQVNSGKFVWPELGIGFPPQPFQKDGPPISISIASPNSQAARTAAQRGWGMLSGNTLNTGTVASHWTVYAAACREQGDIPRGDNWRVSRNILVAPSDAEARDRILADEGANHFFYRYLHDAQRALGVAEPLSVAAMTEDYAIYGSPATVLDRLIAFREQVGPFGGLMLTSLDWSGPNKNWEQESMRLLAQDVMPKLRRHIAALPNP